MSRALLRPAAVLAALTGLPSVLAQTTYPSTDTPISIPDNDPNGIVSTINVPDAGCVQDVDVYVNITHTYRGDLIVELTSPAGTVVRLHNRTGGSADDLVKTYNQGVVNPDGPGSLNSFNGQNLNGGWQLRVSDNANLDVGTLNEWALIVTYSAGPLANNVSAVVARNEATSITLDASSCLGNPLTYVIDTLPSLGVLSDPNGGQILSTPYTLLAGGNVANYDAGAAAGIDTFTYHANDGAADSNLATVSIDVGRVVYDSTDTPIDIPENDPNGITSVIYVSDAGCTADVNVFVDISHTYIGDLIVQLTSPAGVTVRLHNRTGGTTDNIFKTYDQGSVNPDGPGSLNDFIGQDVNGAWTLFVSDNANLDVGTLNAWSLGIVANHTPAAFSQTASVPDNTSTAVTLTGSGCGLPLSFVIESLPASGDLKDPNGGLISNTPYTLVGGGNSVLYDVGQFGGFDSFQFSVNNGQGSNVATVTLRVGTLGPVYDFPLDENPGWSTEGDWAWGTPTGGGTHNFDPTSGYTGDNVYGYNLFGDYANNLGPTYLTTGKLVMSGRYGSRLTFYRWLGVESSTFDHATVEISNDGSNWAVLFEHSGGAISENAWSFQSFDISSFADNRPEVYVRWGMGPTDASVTYPGWNIDDVQVLALLPSGGGECVPCDTNCDGSINGLDIFNFVQALYGNPSTCSPCNSDTDLNGSVNGQDIVGFVHCLFP